MNGVKACDAGRDIEILKKVFLKMNLMNLNESCGCDWLVVMLKSITKLWPRSNYQAFLFLIRSLFRE